MMPLRSWLLSKIVSATGACFRVFLVCTLWAEMVDGAYLRDFGQVYVR
jgi:hypothetical protein